MLDGDAASYADVVEWQTHRHERPARERAGSTPAVGTMEKEERELLEKVNVNVDLLRDVLEEKLRNARTPQAAAKAGIELGAVTAIQKALETLG